MSLKKYRFTLLEILSVVLIIVLLMTIVAGLFKLANSKVKNAEQMSLMKQVETALEAYKSKMGYYIPETNPPFTSQRPGVCPTPFYIFYLDSSGTQGKQTFASYFPNYENIRQKYSVKHDKAFKADSSGNLLPGPDDGFILIGSGGQMKHPGILLDAWGNLMWYRCPGIHNKTKYDLESAGPDGVFGYVTSTDIESDKDCTKAANITHIPADDTLKDFRADNINNWTR